MSEMNKIILCKVLGFLILLAGLWVKNSQALNDNTASSDVNAVVPMLFFVVGFVLIAYSWMIFYKAKKRREKNNQENQN